MQTINQQLQQPPKIKPNRKWKIVLIFVVLVVLLMLILVFADKQNKNQEIQSLQSELAKAESELAKAKKNVAAVDNLEQPQSSNKTTVVLKQDEIDEDQAIDYTKKLFNSQDNFIADEPFPSSLINKDANELEGLYCYKEYEYERGNDRFEIDNRYNDVNQNAVSIVEILSDQFLLDLIEEKKKEDIDIFTINRCISETGKNIVTYQTAGGGGGAGSEHYFALYDTNETLISTVMIKNDDSEYAGAYFNCSKPLLFTKNNVLYEKCTAADGPSMRAVIMEIDFNSKTFEVFYNCYSDLDSGDSHSIICQ